MGVGCYRRVLLMMMLLAVVMVGGHAAKTAGASLEQKCAGEVGTKLLDCLKFADGEAEAPTGKCCQSAVDIRGKDPACLCYVIQQTSEEKPGFKGLGLQLSRLLQLPAVCKIPDSNITDCPRLLDLEPSSPSYTIFNSSAISSNASVGPTSAGAMNQEQHTYALPCVIVSAIVLSLSSS